MMDQAFHLAMIGVVATAREAWSALPDAPVVESRSAPEREPARRAAVTCPGYPPPVSSGTEANLTTDPVELPGVDPADPPTELLPGRLWQGGCPVDFAWVRSAGITAVIDIADADAHPPADAVEGLVYLKAPLVDGEDVPDPRLTLRLARLVAGLVEDGHRVLVHCTFGRNRSGLMASLVVREVLDVDGPTALEHVQSRRRNTVNNEAFARWLRTLPAPR